MKNRFIAAVVVAFVTIFAATSCASGSRVEPDGTSAPIALNAWSAPCNLRLDWQQADGSWAASYSEPTLGAQTISEGYGDLIANDACDDAAILSWQEARRDSGQPDTICRVVWERDPLGIVRDKGCATPVLVTP
jgi:hypothetical protein